MKLTISKIQTGPFQKLFTAFFLGIVSAVKVPKPFQSWTTSPSCYPSPSRCMPLPSHDRMAFSGLIKAEKGHKRGGSQKHGKKRWREDREEKNRERLFTERKKKKQRRGSHTEPKEGNRGGTRKKDEKRRSKKKQRSDTEAKKQRTKEEIHRRTTQDRRQP